MSRNHRNHIIPEAHDPPNVPLDFERYANSQFNYTQGVMNQYPHPDVVSTGQGSVSVISVGSNFPAGDLVYLSASAWVGVINAVIGYYDIRWNGWIVSPQYQIQGQPSGPTFTCDALIINPGPGTFSYNFEMHVSAVQVQYRNINVQAFRRG